MKKEWTKFDDAFGNEIVIDHQQLFDAEAFAAYVEKQSGYSLSKAQTSPNSNSHYFDVVVLDDEGNETEDFRLEVSDHVAAGHFKGAGSPPEVIYDDMPASSEFELFAAGRQRGKSEMARSGFQRILGWGAPHGHCDFTGNC
jgi:hypothetical protein